MTYDIFRILGAAALFTSSALCAGTADAQVTPSDRVKLVQQGFTKADLDAIARALEAPSYLHFKRWNDCLLEIAHLSVRSGKSANNAFLIATTGCVDDEGDARASLARKIGLPNTNRAMAVAKAIVKLRTGEAYADAHPALPAGGRLVGRWELYRGATGTCRIGLIGDPTSVLIEASRGKPGIEVTLIEVEQRGPQVARPTATVAEEHVVLWTSVQPTQIGKVSFDLRFLGDGATLRTFRPSEYQIAQLDLAHQLQLNRSDVFANLTFSVLDFGVARLAVQACARES